MKLDAMATPQFTNALLELAWSHLGMSFEVLTGAWASSRFSDKLSIANGNSESAVVDVEAFAK